MLTAERTPAGPPRTITGREWTELCGHRIPVHATRELTPPAIAALDGVPAADLGNYVQVVTKFGTWTVLRGDVLVAPAPQPAPTRRQRVTALLRTLAGRVLR